MRVVLAVAVLLGLGYAAIAVGNANVNVVVDSFADDTTTPTVPADFASPECAGLPLTVLVVGGGGTGASDLILGDRG